MRYNLLTVATAVGDAANISFSSIVKTLKKEEFFPIKAKLFL